MYMRKRITYTYISILYICLKVQDMIVYFVFVASDKFAVANGYPSLWGCSLVCVSPVTIITQLCMSQRLVSIHDISELLPFITTWKIAFRVKADDKKKKSEEIPIRQRKYRTMAFLTVTRLELQYFLLLMNVAQMCDCSYRNCFMSNSAGAFC